MELISNAQSTSKADLDLTPNQEKELIGYILMQWKEGEKAREAYSCKWNEAKLAYRTQVADEKKRKQNFQSTVALPWTYTAIESWKAYLLSQLFPYDIEHFVLKPVSSDDTKGCDLMQTFLNIQMEKADFFFAMSQALHDLAFGQCVIKINWIKDDYSNNVQYTNVEMDDFMFYPITGDINKSTRIQRLWLFYEDLIATHEMLGKDSPYQNLEKLEPKDDDNQSQESQTDYWSSDLCHKHRQGIELKEAWIHHVRLRADGGKTLKNIVATVAKEKHLIRLQENYYPKGQAPFITTCLVPDEHKNVGWGLTTMAQRLQRAADETARIKLDNIIKTQYQMLKYIDDQEFDPYNFIARPGALIKVGDLGNLQPIDASSQVLQNLKDELEGFKNEFEEATMPRFIRGQLDTIQRTATESNNLQTNASTIIAQHAKRINEKILKPLVEWTYYLTHTMLEKDLQLKINMAKITQNSTQPLLDEKGIVIKNASGEPVIASIPDETLIEKLPKLLPVNEVDVRVIGYENQTQRDKKAVAFMNFMPLFLQSPGAKYANIDNMAEESLRAVGLDPKVLLIDEDKRREADMIEQENAQAEQEAQAQLAMAQLQIQQQALEIERLNVMSKTMTDRQKMQNDFAVNLLKIEVEEQKAGIDVDLSPQQTQLQGLMQNDNLPPQTA